MQTSAHVKCILTDSTSEESSPKAVYAGETDLVGESSSVLGRYPILTQVFKVEVPTVQREKINKGQGRILKGASFRN